MDEQIYRRFVLSPDIGSTVDRELNWHRPLWESFYPRIRKEDSPESAAPIVVRYLRERVAINPKLGFTPGVEIIYVAALRSVGIGAKLNPSGQAEIWTGEKWVDAPRPLSATFL